MEQKLSDRVSSEFNLTGYSRHKVSNTQGVVEKLVHQIRRKVTFSEKPEDKFDVICKSGDMGLVVDARMRGEKLTLQQVLHPPPILKQSDKDLGKASSHKSLSAKSRNEKDSHHNKPCRKKKSKPLKRVSAKFSVQH